MWTPKYLDPTDTHADDLVVTIAAYLRGLDPETTRVSTRAVKDALGLRDAAAERTFTRAVRKLSERGDLGWSLSQRSLVRTVHGFTAVETAQT